MDKDAKVYFGRIDDNKCENIFGIETMTLTNQNAGEEENVIVVLSNGEGIKREPVFNK